MNVQGILRVFPVTHTWSLWSEKDNKRNVLSHCINLGFVCVMRCVVRYLGRARGCWCDALFRVCLCDGLFYCNWMKTWCLKYCTTLICTGIPGINIWDLWLEVAGRNGLWTAKHNICCEQAREHVYSVSSFAALFFSAPPNSVERTYCWAKSARKHHTWFQARNCSLSYDPQRGLRTNCIL
jgi:hypothetical protein